MSLSGSIQLICSPIGNLGDITYRAVELLKRADVIACEDTRHSQRLLSHLEIRGKALVSLHEHNEQECAGKLIEAAQSGKLVAYLTDAGTPTVSDPGYRLVNAAIAADVVISVLPGPSAVLTGLAGSGIPTDAFYFGGFLPVKSGRKAKVLQEAVERAETSVFFESPHRIGKTLTTLSEICPDREVCAARELTKKFETFHRGSAQELALQFEGRKAKGEFTLVIRGAGKRSRK